MKLFGALLIILGIACGLYFGLWWAFIGGIVAIIEEIRADDLSALNVALGVCRVCFAALIGWACAILPIAAGFVCLED